MIIFSLNFITILRASTPSSRLSNYKEFEGGKIKGKEVMEYLIVNSEKRCFFG